MSEKHRSRRLQFGLRKLLTERAALVCVVLLLAVLACIIMVCASAYYSPEVHTQAVSPDGKWIVLVTKRMEGFVEPVEVRIQVKKNWGTHRIWVDAYLAQLDLWTDAEPDSYRIEWQSDREFLVGGRWPQEKPKFRGRYSDHMWVIERLNE
jgi:hypothetical protein